MTAKFNLKGNYSEQMAQTEIYLPLSHANGDSFSAH